MLLADNHVATDDTQVDCSEHFNAAKVGELNLYLFVVCSKLHHHFEKRMLLQL